MDFLITERGGQDAVEANVIMRCHSVVRRTAPCSEEISGLSDNLSNLGCGRGHQAPAEGIRALTTGTIQTA